MGASIARVSPPFQRQALWLATSIKGFICSKARASWNTSSPPIARARPRNRAQSAKPETEEIIKVLDMGLLLVRFAWFQQAIVETHVTAQQAQSAVQQQGDQAADAHHAADQARAHQRRHQHIAVARKHTTQKMDAGT